MSQENVELVRALFETWNAGDMDAFRDLFDPDVICAPARRLAGARTRGRSRGSHAPARSTTRDLGCRRPGTERATSSTAPTESS